VYKKRAFTGLNSNFDRNILDHYEANGSQVYSLMYREKKYQIISELVDPAVWVKSAKVRGMENSSLPVLALPNITPSGREIAKKSEITAKEEKLDERYLFQTPFGAPVKKIEASVAAPTDQTPSGLLSGNSIFQKPVYRLRPTQLIPYRTQFHTDYVVTQMDNSLLFGGLDQYVANGHQVYSLMFREKKYQIISELVDPTVWVKSAKVRGMENSSLPVLALPNITPSGRARRDPRSGCSRAGDPLAPAAAAGRRQRQGRRRPPRARAQVLRRLRRPCFSGRWAARAEGLRAALPRPP
jgi:hypothetical protein